jgi:hypothetical protein
MYSTPYSFFSLFTLGPSCHLINVNITLHKEAPKEGEEKVGGGDCSGGGWGGWERTKSNWGRRLTVPELFVYFLCT